MNSVITHFTDLQFYGFVAGGLAGLLSIIFFLRGKMQWSILLLFASALAMRLTMAGIDPFLNLWDEQYHALVAKNMMNHPLIPTLIENPVLPYDIANWAGNHIWLHKQPLFLWQIALSYKNFGVNEFALRLPLAIMSALCVLMIFRIGKNMTNERIAWCGAFLFAFSNFQLEMVTGSINTDHNDVAFMFYVTASIWAWTEYINNRRMRWIILIGVFAGMAVMVKWLPGLVVFLGWGLVIVSDRDLRLKWFSYKDIILSFLISVVVFMPWQIYKTIKFPLESAVEYRDYGRHFTESMDGHAGDMWFHLDQIGLQYGKVGLFLIVPAFFVLMKAVRQNTWKICLLSIVVAVYFFFTMVATKMPLLCMMVAPILFLALGALFEKSMNLLPIPCRLLNLTTFLILFITGIIYLDIHKIENLHTNLNPDNNCRNTRLHNVDIAKEAAEILPSKEYVVFNCRNFNSILVMYYAGNTAYDWYPDENTYQKFKRKGIKIATFTDDKLPEFLARDNEVFKIDKQFISY